MSDVVVVEHPAHVVDHGQDIRQDENMEHVQSHALPQMEAPLNHVEEVELPIDGGMNNHHDDKPAPIGLERFAEVYNSFKQDCKYDCRQKTAETFGLTPEVCRTYIRRLNNNKTPTKKTKGRPNTVGEDRAKALFETLRMQLDQGTVFKAEELRDLVLSMTEKDIRKKSDGQWFSRKAKFYEVPIRKTGGKPNTKPRTKKPRKNEEPEDYQEIEGVVPDTHNESQEIEESHHHEVHQPSQDSQEVSQQ